MLPLAVLAVSVFGFEVCRKASPPGTAYAVECILCTATVPSGSSSGIHYIASGECAFPPTAGSVNVASGWPVRFNQKLTVPAGVTLVGQVFIRGSNAIVQGGGHFTQRIVADVPAYSNFEVVGASVNDEVAVVLQGSSRRIDAGFENAVITNCSAPSGNVDVAVVNAGAVTVSGGRVMYENVKKLHTLGGAQAFSIESELKAIGSAFITELTDGVQPAWIGSMQRAAGWLTAVFIGTAFARYSIYRYQKPST